MDATIVIPVKNGGSLLEQVLTAIDEQETKYSYEVICIDSGSSDNSIEIIKSHPCTLFQISPEEFGHGKTRNFGASKGTGDFIIFLTQDALPYNNQWLDNLLNGINSSPDIAGAFGAHEPYPDCNILDKRDIVGHFKGFGSENTVYFLEDIERYENEEGYRHLLSYFSDNNSCIRRSIWKKIPYDDVNFAEDQIWARKIIEQGYKKIFIPSAIVYHSHNYNPKSFYGRYFDEYKGLYDLHQYMIVPSKKLLFPAMMKHIVSDIRYVWSIPKLSFWQKIKNTIYVTRRERCRYLAGWRGGIYHTLSKEKQAKWDKKYSQQYQQIKG